ncbi:hypothetical protein [Sphingomonas sanxanigenens]|uniref:Uncharacterized protein n=1 Tax=Sphingomonas sanxanigenens DSM 19645 = NX02 TaxID=1123269 RepID=W0AIA1_9SPHN|nr:hypothetical protein [Sphingomonas sanxanigenens]AHE55993.1 hypothetical protein NX02_21815 [Sphingomonas sanxanigenens DSM 19645 = NX02]
MIPGTILAGAGSFAMRHWKAFAAGAVVLALVGALWLARRDAAAWEEKAGKRQEELAGERAAHAVTLASVHTLQISIERQNADAKARAAALEQAKAQAAADVAAADERWQSTADQVERLKALARQPARPGCEASKALLKELEGL